MLLKNNYLVIAFFQQLSRYVHGFLRTDFPVAAEIEPIDPAYTFFTAGNFQESITRSSTEKTALKNPGPEHSDVSVNFRRTGHPAAANKYPSRIETDL